jgi:hypothetical protein
LQIIGYGRDFNLGIIIMGLSSLDYYPRDLIPHHIDFI